MGPDLGTRLGLLAAAMAIEAIAGYPGALYRAAGHPVTWFGALIGWLDRALNRDGPEPSSTPHPVPLPKEEGTRAATTDNPSSPPLWGEGQGEGWGRVQFLRQRLAGVMALLVLLTTTIAVAISLQCALAASWPGLFLLGLLVSALLATRSLDTHVGAVAAALVTGGLDAGRLAVSQIVGRDPEALDEAGVCRAAIESLAENFSDGVIAPALWFAVAGLPGMVAYKVINTADSMIGHRTPRHEAFGWASARLDDLVNLPASRMSAALLVAASCLLPSASPAAAIRAVIRDAGKHRSPNAGWPEAAMAGALGLQLAGPRSYHGVMTNDMPMGEGRANANPADIGNALRLYRLAAGLGWLILILAAGSRW